MRVYFDTFWNLQLFGYICTYFFSFFFQFTRYWLNKIMHFSFEWVSGPGILYIWMVVCYCHQFILFVKYIWTWIEDILRDRPIFLLYHGFYSKSSFSYIEVLSNFSYPVTSSLIFRFNYNLVRSILFTESSKKNLFTNCRMKSPVRWINMQFCMVDFSSDCILYSSFSWGLIKIQLL